MCCPKNSQGVFSMKHTTKLFGIIAFVAKIAITTAVLSLTGCDNGTTGNGGSSGGELTDEEREKNW
jgi:hypothetical protein